MTDRVTFANVNTNADGTVEEDVIGVIELRSAEVTGRYDLRITIVHFKVCTLRDRSSRDRTAEKRTIVTIYAVTKTRV